MAIDSGDPASTLTIAETAAVGAPEAARVFVGRTRKDRALELARALLRSKTFVVGAVILLFWIVDAVFWRAFVPYDPQAIDPLQPLKGPSSAHWFGTDNLGRDVFSRVLAGAGSVLVVATLATALGIAGGTVLGLLTGYYHRFDDIASRLVEAVLAFPLIIIAVLVLSVLGRSTVNVILVIGIVFTPIVSRTVRAAVLSSREREYVAAAKLRGESDLYIMFAEILPNITGPLTVESTVRLGYAVFTAATLAFLGLGIGEPSPDWGLTISLGRQYLQIAPWVVLFPAAALATLVVAVNLVVDGLKKAMEE
ncbi:MAG: ABC transporter permease [Gaiellaceae bacterium]